MPLARPLVLVAGTDLLRPERAFLRRRLPFAELWGILEGRGEFGVGEEFFPVEAGDLVMHQPFQPQSAQPAPGGFLRYHWVHLDLLAPDPAPSWSQSGWDARVELSPPQPRWVHATLATPPRLRPHNPSDFRLLFARTVEAYARGAAGTALAAALCHQLLLAIADECSPPAAPPPEAAQRAVVRRMQAYIHRHASRPLTLAELGEVACLHPVYFGRLFKRHVGEPPLEYLNRIRIQSAQAILRAEPERSVASIAEEVGFTSLPHFHRTFKRYTGTTPHAFRSR